MEPNLAFGCGQCRSTKNLAEYLERFKDRPIPASVILGTAYNPRQWLMREYDRMRIKQLNRTMAMDIYDGTLNEL
jgi:hypothetical protein